MPDEFRTSNPFVDYVKEQLSKAPDFITPFQYFDDIDNPGGGFTWWAANSQFYEALPSRTTIPSALALEFGDRLKTVSYDVTPNDGSQEHTTLYFDTFFACNSDRFTTQFRPGWFYTHVINPGIWFVQVENFYNSGFISYPLSFANPFNNQIQDVPRGSVGYGFGAVGAYAGSNSQIGFNINYSFYYIEPEQSCDCCCCPADSD